VKTLKTLTLCTCIILATAGFIFPESSFSQCNGVIKSVSYSTVLTGTGNDEHVFLLPQFDPSKGTLVAVKISNIITLDYSFQLENNSHSAVSYTLGVGRNDWVGCSALSSPLTNASNVIDFGPYALAASDGVTGSGPDFISVPPFNVLNNYADITDSITSGMNGFMGTGNVSFDYFTTTFYQLSGNYNFNQTPVDTMNFKISYYYCSVTVIASSIMDFQAALQKDNDINLSWQIANEHLGRVYATEKSADGVNFTSFGTVKSSVDTTVASYAYPYTLTSSDKNRVYFRLRITDENNNISYSGVSKVDLGEQSAQLSLYPNPAHDYINILFPRTVNNIAVDLLSSSGETIQRYAFKNTNMPRINAISQLAPGVYFIHVYDLDQHKSYVLPLMTQ